jgi:hypothetical protein
MAWQSINPIEAAEEEQYLNWYMFYMLIWIWNSYFQLPCFRPLNSPARSGGKTFSLKDRISLRGPRAPNISAAGSTANSSTDKETFLVFSATLHTSTTISVWNQSKKRVSSWIINEQSDSQTQTFANTLCSLAASTLSLDSTLAQFLNTTSSSHLQMATITSQPHPQMATIVG